MFVARGTPMLPELWRFHQLAHGGCSAITYAKTEHVPKNTVVMVGPHQWEIKDAVGRVEVAPVQMRDSAARFRDGLHACTRSYRGARSNPVIGYLRSTRTSCSIRKQYYTILPC